MIVALTYTSETFEDARNLLQRMRDLGPLPKLVLSREIAAAEIGTEIEAQRTFYVDKEERWPNSKNLAFQSIAWLAVRKTIKEPFLYLEPDCMPTRPGWFEEIEAEYRAGGKPFMGPIVEASAQYGTPRHMAAIAVYSPNLLPLGCGDALNCSEVPFPAAIARVVLRMVHPSKTIVHDWKGEGIPEHAALYHPSRNLPAVPVLADAERTPQKSAPATAARSGEARESTKDEVESEVKSNSDSRGGGQSNLSGGVESRHAGRLANSLHGANSGSHEPKEAETRNSGSSAPPAQNSPWESPLDSINRIRAVCAELKTYCDSPRHTATVREELWEAHVLKKYKLPGRNRRRRRKRKTV